MSIPFYFDILMKDGTVRKNQRVGTISYGLDLNDPKTWIREFYSYGEYPEMKEFLGDFEAIEVIPQGITVLKSDILEYARQLKKKEEF